MNKGKTCLRLTCQLYTTKQVTAVQQQSSLVLHTDVLLAVTGMEGVHTCGEQCPWQPPNARNETCGKQSQACRRASGQAGWQESNQQGKQAIACKHDVMCTVLLMSDSRLLTPAHCQRVRLGSTFQ